MSYLYFLAAVDRCLSLDYALGNYVQGDRLTELNVYVEGTGKAKTKLQTYKTTTDYNWRTATVSIEAVENLVVGVILCCHVLCFHVKYHSLRNPLNLLTTPLQLIKHEDECHS